MAGRKFGEPYRLFRVCVDSYEAGALKGWLCHPEMENEGAAFQSLAQMLVRMENMMDEARFPQAFTAKRTFLPVETAAQTAEAIRKRGEKATFVVRVMFRQHTSWQGSVTWLEGHNEETFRSVLELILLMDSALGGCQTA